MVKSNKKGEVYWSSPLVIPGCVGFCPSEEAWNKCLKTYKIYDEEYPTVDGRTTSFKLDKPRYENFILITLNNLENRSLLQIHGLLAHECVHAFDQLCEWIGEDSPSKEFKAYYVQRLFMDMAYGFEMNYEVKNT